MMVEYADHEPNGLADMVGGLIEANLERDAGRRALLKPAVIAITAADAEVSVTLRLEPGRVKVANGLTGGSPDVFVRADSGTLLELSSVPLRFGLPDVLSRGGRRLVGKLLAREIRVDGMIRHPRKLARLNLLLSVE